MEWVRFPVVVSRWSFQFIERNLEHRGVEMNASVVSTLLANVVPRIIRSGIY